MRIPLFVAAAIAVTAVLGAGCSKDRAGSNATLHAGPSSAVPPSADAWQPATESDLGAIGAAIEEHVHNDHSVNMGAMNMSVDSASVNGNQARAEAAFRLKQGGTGMAMRYFLERRTNGWIVTRSEPSDGQFVHPPIDGTPLASPTNRSETPTPDLTDFWKSHPSDSKN